MTAWFLLFSDIAAGNLRAVVGLSFLCRLFSHKKPDKKRLFAAVAGMTALSMIGTVMGLSDLYRLILEILLITLCTGPLQAPDFRMRLFVSVFYGIALSLCQFLVAAWAGVLFHAPAFLDHSTARGQISVWLFHALLIACALYFGKKADLTERKAFRFASGIVVAAFIAVITLSEQRGFPLAEDTLEMWTILAVVLMMSLLVFNVNRQYEVEKELARLKTEQAALLERDYTALNNAYAVNAKLFHDFHNHIGILRQLLSHGKPEEAIRYLDGLQAPVREMTETLWTGDETTDHILSRKAMEAKEKGIPFQAQVEFPRHTNLGGADLCAILGNLLDNALEAAGQVPEKEERFIRLTIRRINQMLVIKVENSFCDSPVSENGVLATTKEKNGLHGWGLKSARAAAEKYDGTLRTSYTDHVFRAVATLSFRCVSDS